MPLSASPPPPPGAPRRAWAGLRGTSQQDAMRQYTQLADVRLAALGLYSGSPEAGDGGGGGGGGRGGGGGGLGGPVVSRLVYGEEEDGGGGGGGSSDGAGGLHELAGEGDEAALAAALSGGAPVDARDGSGCTPLHFAADRGRVAALRLLLAAGADVDAVDEEGQTALHYAAVCGQREVRRADGLGGGREAGRWGAAPRRRAYGRRMCVSGSASAGSGWTRGP
jgi:hypothetical protein